MNYLKISQASELQGKDRKLYRALEMMPGVLSWLTLIILFSLSYFRPVGVAYFIIAFDVYWLLLVIFLGVHLFAAYHKLKRNLRIDWQAKCQSLDEKPDQCRADTCLSREGLKWREVVHLVIYPVVNESYDVMHESVKAFRDSSYPGENIIMVLSIEERGGERVWQDALQIKEKFKAHFKLFYLTRHPDGLVGELKGKGANQHWAAKQVKQDVIDKEGIPYDRILVNVFDIDTVIHPGYLHCLTYNFLTVRDPYRASYQPVPVYHNNIWQSPFFARVAASSNTFWQMMQQIRPEKLATYSSHSMTWQALNEIGFWSKTMVSEDSRIFWHCFCHYRGDYRVRPLNFPVSMDVCMDESVWQTAKNLYKQQRRWGWGVENIPYLMFNFIKNWRVFPKRKFINRILVQLYGFHSWATNALIIGVIGWMPMFLGGDRFNETVLSTNLPFVTRTLMTIAMIGLVLSAIFSTLLLPKKPRKYSPLKYLVIVGQWIILPLSIIFFGAVPGLDSQSRLMLGGKRRLGFFVTPKSR